MNKIFSLMKVALAFLIIFCISCDFSNNKKETQNKALSDRWVKDTLGCKQYRTKALALELINSNQLMNETKEKFLNVFQTPNQITTVDGREVLTYYFNTMCEHGKLVAGSDLCYARFYFKGNKLVETGFACE